MKKDYLKELNELILVMTSAEKLLILKQLKVGYSNLKSNEKKMFQLFQFVKNGNQPNYEKLKKKVSPNSTKESFNRLLRRLMYRLEESLILEQNINRKDAYSELFRIRHRLKKQLIQAQILLSRGMVVKSVGILKRVERDAENYELFNELIEATTMYYSISIATNKLLQANRLKNKLEKSFIKRNSLDQIKHLINSFELYSRNNRKALLKELENTIFQVEAICNSMYTDNSKAYLLLLKLELAENKNDLKLFITEGQFLLNLLESKKSVYSKSRIIYLNNKLSRYYLYLFEFLEAETKAKEAISWFGESLNSNYLNSIECLFLSNFYRSNYKLAENILQKDIDNELTKKFPTRLSSFYYYIAVVHFLLKDYRQSLTNLNQTTEIEKDKEGWNIWIRLLRVMILIEQDKQGLLEYEIESFRKYIQRSEIKSNERINLILSLLIELERRDFDFSLASEKRVEELSRLENDEKVCWRINSPELIQFHTWFKAKRDGVEYQAVFKQS